MSDLKKCPKCNTENPQVANFCRKCRYEFPEATKGGLSVFPEIKSLRIIETQYVVGSTIHIEWNVNNFTKIELAGEDVTFYNGVELLVERAVELNLVATNDYDQVEQLLKVLPTPLPKIHRFVTSHNNVLVGKSITLFWNVEGAIKVLLKYDTEEVDVSTLEKLKLSPVNATIYTLIAFSVDNKITVERSVHVKVLSEVVIRKFSSDMEQTLESQPIELRWEIDNADKIMLYPNDIEVTRQTSIRLYPNITTTYQLEASNILSIKEQVITIGVKTLPRLDIKVSDSLSRLNIPDCEIDFSSLSGFLKETNIDRWMLDPSKQPIVKKIREYSIFKRLKMILPKRIK